MFFQSFLSPQVKRWAIITYKHCMYEMHHEFPNELRLGILGNYETSGKCLNPPPRCAPPDMRTSLKYCASYCSPLKTKELLRFINA